MSVENSLFSTVLHIRKKQKTGKPLEKWEKEFFRENEKLISMKKRQTEEERTAMDDIRNWLSGKE